MKSKIYCLSCGRSNGSGLDSVEVFSFKGDSWCVKCASVKTTNNGDVYILTPSPGRMTGDENDILATWQDCFLMTPKKKVLKNKAKDEITRAWESWEGDKLNDMSMFLFYGWLTQYRPYFLTFRDKGDRWQTVHSWLLRYESLKKRHV